jgi:nicotinamidase-related amidase
MGKLALLLLDLQTNILTQCNSNAESYTSRVSAITHAARAASIPVIYVRICFRPSYPELNPRNASASRVISSGAYTESDPSVEFPASIAPLATDIVVTKRRVSAFVGSDLEVMLRGLGIDELVLFGLSTSGAVLSTVRMAADMDFGLTVLGDMCVDRKDDVHKVLVEQVFVRQARVMRGDEWIEEVAKGVE